MRDRWEKGDRQETGFRRQKKGDGTGGRQDSGDNRSEMGDKQETYGWKKKLETCGRQEKEEGR